MSNFDKVSEAFEPFFEKDPTKKRSAIVVYQDSNQSLRTNEDRAFRKVAERSKLLNEITSNNQKTFQAVLNGYLAEAKFEVSGEINYRIIGNGRLPLASLEVNRNTLKVLAEQPNVVAVLPNQPVHLLSPVKSFEIPERGLTPIEKEKNSTWGIQQLQVQELWEQAGNKGKGIKIAVIDTGVYGDHPTLRNKVSDFTIIDPAGQWLELKDKKTYDCQRHGTHVCGTIAGGATSAGIQIGVAPEVSLAVAQIHFDRSFLSNIIDAIDWAYSVGADIINMSIGCSYYDPKIDDVLKVLVDRGIAPIVSIGNQSHGSTSCPGNAFHSLGIGAIEEVEGRLDVAFFSGGGSLDFPETRRRIVKPDVVAPGVSVYSCVPPISEVSREEYKILDGTSMASPHVAGIVAIIMSACPRKSVEDIFQAIRETAEHPNGKDSRPDNRWGYGIINPLGALNKLKLQD